LKKVVIFVLCLFLFTPVASAFSFSEFFNDMFGVGSITGMAIGDRCRADRDCGRGEVCTLGTCSASTVCGNKKVESGETCDGNSQSCTTGDGYSGTQNCNSGCNGWSSCSTSESCGDGTTNGNEGCDDGNSVNTDSCKNDCTSPSSGDGVCSASETCVTDVGACGECNIETQEPSITFVLSSPAIANVFTVNTLEITRGTQCFISISKHEFSEYQTRRGRKTTAVRLTKNRITCDNARSEAQEALRELSNGKYEITIAALNNIGQVYVVQDLIITGGAIEISGLIPGYFYSDYDVPSVSVTSTSSGSCTYKVNDGNPEGYTCSDGINSLDLSSLSSQGQNTFYLIIAVSGITLTYSASYLYLSDIDFVGEVVSSSFGGGGPGGESSSMVLGDLGNANFLEPAAGNAAISAILLNLGRSGKVSLSERNEMLGLFKNNAVLKKEIAAISSATGLSELSFGVVRTVALTNLKAQSGYIATLALYTSAKSGSTWSSVLGKEKEFTFTRLGSESIRVKIR
jgi:cysteine-rich repeat protein